MLLNKKQERIEPKNIASLLYSNFSNLMSEFYEMQSTFLSTRYLVHKSIETSNIIICLIRSAHLAIIRQREKNLDHDLSLENFFSNLSNNSNLGSISHKVVSIVKTTGIPKETVRRKLKQLILKEYIAANKNKEYYWQLSSKRKERFVKIMKQDIKAKSKFIHSITLSLNYNFSQKTIEDEIEANFSFYFYHFLSCQLAWLKMWQTKIKDVDLIFIAMQVLIPTLKYEDKTIDLKKVGLDKIYTVLGKTDESYHKSDTSVSAASIADVTGIPRATCIRKLDKLVKLGLLIREVKTKRYFINQLTSSRTKNIITKDNVSFTIAVFSEYLSIVINALLRNKEQMR